MDLLADEVQPLVIAARCKGLIRALSEVKPKRGQVEIYGTDHELYSHPPDALRYLLVNLPVMSAAHTLPEAEPNFWGQHGRIW